MKTLDDMKADLRAFQDDNMHDLLTELGIDVSSFIEFTMDYGVSTINGRPTVQSILSAKQSSIDFIVGYQRALSLFREEIKLGTEILEMRKELDGS